MEKIEIKWEVVSPFLKQLVGTVHIMDVDLSTYKHKTIAKFKVEKTDGQFGYLFNPPVKSETVEKYTTTIRSMVDSYFSGVKLEPDIYHWVEENETGEKP